MKSSVTINGIYFEEPLEKLRALFRQYWVQVNEGQDEDARQLWETEVAVEVESVRQYQSNIEDQDIQALFFEEKRRVQDLTFIADQISKKLVAAGVNRAAVDVSSTQGLQSRASRRSEADVKTQRAASAGATASKPAGGLDLTSMIDSMLEEERT